MRHYILLFTLIACPIMRGNFDNMPEPARSSILDTAMTQMSTFGISSLMQHTPQIGKTPVALATLTGAAIHYAIGYSLSDEVTQTHTWSLLLHALGNIGLSHVLNSPSEQDISVHRDGTRQQMEKLSNSLYAMMPEQHHNLIIEPNEDMYKMMSQYLQAYYQLHEQKEKKERLHKKIQDINNKMQPYEQIVPSEITIAESSKAHREYAQLDKQLQDTHKELADVASYINQYHEQQSALSIHLQQNMCKDRENALELAIVYTQYYETYCKLREIEDYTAKKDAHRAAPWIATLLYVCKAAGMLHASM